jgi:peptidoglycan/LPS O-acetylase OafA/YrhL
MVLILLPADNLLLTGVRISTVNLLAYRLIRRVIQPGKPAAAFTWLSRAVPVHMGNISYSLYLYHPIVLFLVARHFRMVDPSHPWKIAGVFALALSATLAMSTLSLYAMERPVQRLRRFILK